MIDKIRSPYIIRMTEFGVIDARFDTGSLNGADNSKMIAKSVCYPVLYKGVVNDDVGFDAVMDGVKYANESKRAGRFDPLVFEEMLPNLSAKPVVVG